MNSIMIIRTFQLNMYQRRIIHQAVRLEKIFRKLNIPTDYYEMWSRNVIEYTTIGIIFCLVSVTLYDEDVCYIYWECLNAYFSIGISYVVISFIRLPLLNTSLDKLNSVVIRITNHSPRRPNNMSKLAAIILLSKAHTILFESLEYIREIASKFTICLFCFNALQILLLFMTSQTEDISTTFWVIAIYDFSIIFYIIISAAETKKKVSYFNKSI